MEVNKENFKKGKYDIFSMFNDQWALVAAGNPEKYNVATVGWGMMGSIWGLPNKGKQVVTIFLRESSYTSEILKEDDNFTVNFFPEKYRYDLGMLRSKSGRDNPDKISLTSLTPKMLDNSVTFEEAKLTFVCKKIYVHKLDGREVPADVMKKLYPKADDMHYVIIGEIQDVFGVDAQ